MKKLLIFLTLVLTIQATQYEEIAKQAAETTNLHFEKEMSELINCENVKEIKILEQEKPKGNFSIGYSINTTHIKANGEYKENYDFYENNKCLTLEYSKDKKFISLSFFDNSFGNESKMLLFGNYTDKNNQGFYFKKAVGIVKGYNKKEILIDKNNKDIGYVFYLPNVIYKDYALCAVIGSGYNFNNGLALEVDLLANTIVTNVIYRF